MVKTFGHSFIIYRKKKKKKVKKVACEQTWAY